MDAELLKLLVILLSALLMGALTLYFFLNPKPSKPFKNKKLPPGTMGLPFIGETLAYLKPHSAISAGSFMENHVSRFGKIFKSHLFGHPTIVSTDPELNKMILQNEEKLFQCSYPSAIAGILGKYSMLVLVGDLHKQMRNIALSFMTTPRLRANLMHDIDNLALTCVESFVHGCAFFAQSESKKYTFNLMAKQILSYRAGELRTEALMREYFTFMKGVVSVPINLPGTTYRRALKSRATILKVVEKEMEKRRENNVLPEEDWLSIVIAEGNLNNEQILDLILNLLFAGHETSSVALSLSLYFLANSPDIVEELRKEHLRIRENKESKYSKLTWEDYKNMEFTHQVINETLRLGNVVRFVHRKALGDVDFKGFCIPGGWKVLPIFDAVHLDSEVYHEPFKFDPCRWQKKKAENNNNSSYFTPFGGGPRLCTGMELAKLEIAIFLHHLVLRYRWEKAEEDVPMVFPFVEFEKGLPIRVALVSDLQ